MIHRTDRDVVLAQISTITQQIIRENSHIWHTAKNLQQDILFSTKAYKQHGARYSKQKAKQAPEAVKTVLAEKERSHG
jgi:hypothetical protein